MNKKTFDILDYIKKAEIIKTLNYLGAKNLTCCGHGFEIYGAIPIEKAANKSTMNYSNAWKLNPAMGLICVVLAANRNYNSVVEPNLRRMKLEEPELKTFTQLSQIIQKKGQDEFYKFWGHKDEKKFNTLKNILTNIERIRINYPNFKNDYDLTNLWAKNADILNHKQDIIGSIPNVGIATFQHLRMVFGIDTIKPDHRVKEVLNKEFGLSKLTGQKAIIAAEQIAIIAKIKVINVDQIIVKYGSSYYNQKVTKTNSKNIKNNNALAACLSK